MTASGARAKTPSDFATDDENLKSRELRASCAAGRQELSLRRSAIRCGGHDDHRYDLIHERYNQPVATDLHLTAVEVWLGIREADRYR